MAKRKGLSVPPEINTFPTRLRYARERANLTRTALASKAKMGLPQYSRIESGERSEGIELTTVIRLAQALGTPVGWLAADEGEPGPVPVFREGSDRRRKPNRD